MRPLIANVIATFCWFGFMGSTAMLPADEIPFASQASLRHQTDDSLAHLSPDATELRLHGPLAYGVDQVTDAGIAHLAGHKHLKTITAAGLKLTDESLKTFGTIESLEELRLHSNKITGAGLKHLLGLKRLRVLDLSFNDPAPEAFETLGQLTGLESLGISSTTLHQADDMLTQLSRLTNLKQLNLPENSSDITDAGLASLSRLSKLQYIRLRQNSHVTNAGLAQLNTLHDLRGLELYHLPYVDSTGLAWIFDAKKLERLSFEGVALDQPFIGKLSTLPDLAELLLWNVESGPKFVITELGPFQSLRGFRSNHSLSRSAIAELVQCKSLMSIENDLAELTNDELAQIAKLPKIQTLELASPHLNADSLPLLASMKSLKWISVSRDVPITAEQWTALRTDSLPGCEIVSREPPYMKY
jgi:hypothetical protein